VVVVEENHSGADILGNPAAPYLNSLAKSGVSLQAMYAIRHPSEPNYLALFSGSTHGLTGDPCPVTFSGTTIAGELLTAGLTFTGYAEGLPHAGSTVCSDGPYARKHVPWADYPSLPPAVNQPLSAFPTNYSTLASLSFVIPDLNHDMHDGTVAQADQWLRTRLGGYATWAASHGSLLIVTWDEDDRSEGNRIPTVVVGAGVRPHVVGSRTSLYSLLRLLADRFGVHRIGASATAPAIPLQ
jgi:acid phosphatase